MPLLKQAWLGLKNNQHIVFSFLLASAAITLAFSAINQWLKGQLDEGADTIPVWYASVRIVLDLLHAAVRAACYAIFFALLGAELHKPLWKHGQVGEALKRFFLPWFILGLGMITLVRMQEGILRTGVNVEFIITIEMFILLAYLFAVPFGACVMFLGRFEWGMLGEAMKPLWRLFSLTILVLLVNFGQYVFLQVMLAVMPDVYFQSPLTFAVLEVPHALLNLLAFAMCWEILRMYQLLELDQEE